MTDGDYEVGYRRPPREHQFKKGTSGNPRGRPRKLRTFDTALMEELRQTRNIAQDGVTRSVTLAELVAISLLNRFLTGRAKTFEVRYVMDAVRRRSIHAQQVFEVERKEYLAELFGNWSL